MRLSLHRGPIALALVAASAVALPATASATTQAQTIANLKKIVKSMPAGTSVFAHEAKTGLTLASLSPTTGRVPASVTKLFTTSTALMLDGPSTVLNTTIRADGTVDADGKLDGDLIVRGDGNPGLTLANINTLAAAVKSYGIKKISGGLRVDMNGWTAAQGTPLTGGAYNREISGRIGPLVVLRGYASATQTDPGKQVLVRLRAALKSMHVSGSMAIGTPTTGTSDMTLVASVPSPTVAQLVASTLGPSDNFYAEMLLRGVGARHGAAGTTAAGLAVERTALSKLGVTATLNDGSGLSHGNRASPVMVVKLLDKMALRTEASALRNGMALAGSTGTVAGRMRGSAAAGRCRVKTGTLSNASALAGYCTTLGKRQVTFAVINNNTSVASDRALQDRVAIALASWSDAPGAGTVPTPTPAPKTSSTTAPAPAPGSTSPGGITVQ